MQVIWAALDFCVRMW